MAKSFTHTNTHTHMRLFVWELVNRHTPCDTLVPCPLSCSRRLANAEGDWTAAPHCERVAWKPMTTLMFGAMEGSFSEKA